MIGLDHAIWHRFQDRNGNWQPAAQPNWIRVGTLAASEISVTRLPNGSSELAAIDTTNRNLWHINVPASGTPSTDFVQIGDNSNKAKHINISQFHDGRLVVFMVGLDDVIWQTWQNGSGSWLPAAAPHFERVGDGSSTSRACTNCPNPMLVSRNVVSDAFDVVILDQNRNLRNLFILPGFFAQNNNFYLINDTSNMGTQIAVNRGPDNRLELFMLGLDSTVWRTWQTIASGPDNPGGTWQTTAPNNLVSLGSTTARTLATIRTLDGHSDLFIIGVLSHTNGEYLGPTIFKNLQGNNYRTPGAQLVVSQHQQNLDGIRLDSRAFVTFPDENTNIATGFLRQGPVFATELWNPQTATFTTMASSQVPRAYHSTAVLLPDGRVPLAGGGAGGNPADPNHANAEIYSPPYLDKRPITVLSAPASIHYNVSFTVQVNTADGYSAPLHIAGANLIGLSQTTHSFNQGQRLNHLTVSQSGGTVTITPPQNANRCPPGPYMLFLLNDEGGISKARMVQIN
jgi:galactose oxidase-like protein